MGTGRDGWQVAEIMHGHIETGSRFDTQALRADVWRKIMFDNKWVILALVVFGGMFLVGCWTLNLILFGVVQ